MKRLKHPVQYAREHENRWAEGEDAYVRTEWIDTAMGRGWEESELPEPDTRYHVFVDIGLVHDPTVIAIGHGDRDGLVYIDKLVTHQGSKACPVDLGMLRAELRSISSVWRAKVRIESWQGQTLAQDLVRGGVRADIRTPTAKSQGELWNTLAAELANGQVVLPRHERLREELLNLRVELRAGGGIRVTDRGKLHQDHAVAAAGVVEMVLEARQHWATGPMRVSNPARYRIDDHALSGSRHWRRRPRVLTDATQRRRAVGGVADVLREAGVDLRWTDPAFAARIGVSSVPTFRRPGEPW